jgi:hypothetical protein
MSASSIANPYPGLRPFELEDRRFFFGRESQTKALRDKVVSTRLVAVVGRSGCGKSSLVRAGLVHALAQDSEQSGTWQIATFRPQGRPFDGLIDELLRLRSPADAKRRSSASDEAPAKLGDDDAAALRRSRMEAMLRRSSHGLLEAARELAAVAPGKLLIIIDQFEEIFRFEGARREQADEATAFARLLVQTANGETPPIHIVLTMRLDFLGDCARFQGLPELINRGQFLVPNLTRSERRAAIEEPAVLSDRPIAPALTQRLLNDAGDDPDELPVLQHVLMRTWQQKVDPPSPEVGLTAYGLAGGFKDAISSHATEVFQRLSSPDQQVAERLFKAISDLDVRGRAVRRPRKLGEIAAMARSDLPTVVRIVEAFRAPDCCFLTPLERPLDENSLIDITHESLLRRWSKMTGTATQDGWLVQEDKDGKTYRGLLAAAESFQADSSAVLSPKILSQRRAWMKRAQPNAEWAERYGGHFELVEQLLQASQKRVWRRRIWIAAAAILVVGLGLSWGVREAAIEIERLRLTQELARRGAEYEAVLANVNQQNKELEKQLADSQAAIQRTVDSVGARQQQVLESTIRRDQANRVQSDAVVQVPQTDAGRPSTPTDGTSLIGYLWIGSEDAPTLQTVEGSLAKPPAGIVDGQTYTVVPRNIYVRESPPDESYAQGAALAIIKAGTRVEARGTPIAYQRSLGTQYWLRVRVLPQALSTVHFQFATAPRPQAQEVSSALQNKGYVIPGEERTESAKGQHEVRYRDEEDKPAAERLAQDTAQSLKSLGYNNVRPPAVVPLTAVWRNKSPKGVLQLWLDLPARAQ